jgi:hypothetical protein
VVVVEISVTDVVEVSSVDEVVIEVELVVAPKTVVVVVGGDTIVVVVVERAAT